jgi:dolichol-phosphate mannosyltransferase
MERVPAPQKVSLAIPLYNEAAVVPELLRRTASVLDSLPGGPHEIVLVDDGSTDGTLHQLVEAAKHDARIVIVSLSRNFGHQAALTAALDHVSGDVAVVMDADLQDTPESIPQFLEQYRNGYDVVYAVRTDRKEGRLLRLSYQAFYRLIAAVADIPLPLGSGDFALLSRRVVDLLREAPERHRYLRGLRTWLGFRQIGIPVERASRHAGRPKYNLVKLFQLACDGIFAFSILPLRLAALVGFFVMVSSLLYAAYAVFERLFLEPPPQGFTTLIVAITFLSGVQLLFLGIIGEYVGRIYDETKRRPKYVVEQVIRNNDS